MDYILSGLIAMRRDVQVVFWVYENWRNNGHRARVHIESCRHCSILESEERSNAGQGSKWYGPFLTIEDALSLAKECCDKVSLCRTCLKNAEYKTK